MSRAVYRKCLKLAAILALPLAFGGMAAAQVSDVTEQQPATDHYDELVAKLAYPSFEIRQQAASQLRHIGAPARPALLKALKSEDLEVRMAAHRVLVHIMQADFDAQLQAFIQGNEQADFELPGWQRFANLVGDKRATRRLFAAMVRDEPELLEKLADVSEQAEALQQLFEQRVQLLSNASRVGRSQHLSIPCIATLLLISQQSQVRSIGAESRLYSFLTMQSVQEEITTGEHYPVLQTMLSSWVISGKSEHYALRIALAYRLRLAGTDLARRILTADDVNYSAVAYAAMLLARFGDSADLKLLLPHLSNTNVFHTWHNLPHATLPEEPGFPFRCS